MSTITEWDQTTSTEAEHGLVGIALHDANVVDEVTIEPADFHDPRCEAVWTTIQHLRGQGGHVDPVTVHANLRTGIRGIDLLWLGELVINAPVAALADHYARLIVEAATLRRLAATATRIQQMVRDKVPGPDAIEMARAEIDACVRSVATTGFVADHFGDMLDALEEEPDLIPTPWADLNHIIGGWRPGALYVIGARPAAGKTMMSTQAAVEIARAAAVGIARTGGAVALSNLEMSRREVMFRITAQMAGVHLGRILDRKLTDDDWARITKCAPAISALPLSIDDNPRARPVDVKAHARTVARTGSLGAIIVDYIQLMSAAPGDKRPRQEVVAEFSRDLKILAKELHVPVLALAQLNRESARGAAPVVADLRESGSLEQDADVVLLLHIDPEDETELNVGVGKNRHGPTGTLKLVRRGHLARLDDLAWQPS